MKYQADKSMILMLLEQVWGLDSKENTGFKTSAPFDQEFVFELRMSPTTECPYPFIEREDS